VSAAIPPSGSGSGGPEIRCGWQVGANMQFMCLRVCLYNVSFSLLAVGTRTRIEPCLTKMDEVLKSANFLLQKMKICIPISQFSLSFFLSVLSILSVLPSFLCPFSLFFFFYFLLRFLLSPFISFLLSILLFFSCPFSHLLSCSSSCHLSPVIFLSNLLSYLSLSPQSVLSIVFPSVSFFFLFPVLPPVHPLFSFLFKTVVHFF
jgi:hypothetical protein